MDIERFDSAPVRWHMSVAQAFGKEGAGVGDVGEARVNGVSAGIEDQVVNGLSVGASRGFCRVVGGYGLESCSHIGGARVSVERAVQGREEVVDVAVEGGDAEGMRAVFEEEGVNKGAVLGELVSSCSRRRKNEG